MKSLCGTFDCTSELREIKKNGVLTNLVLQAPAMIDCLIGASDDKAGLKILIRSQRHHQILQFRVECSYAPYLGFILDSFTAVSVRLKIASMFFLHGSGLALLFNLFVHRCWFMVAGLLLYHQLFIQV